MNDVALNGNGGAVSANTTNYFESYGDQVSQKSIVGTLLKFSKGDWLAGESNEEVKPGTQLIANMDELLVGWVRWEGGKPSDQIMGQVAKGYQAPKRNTLGDDDEADWERDDNGKPRDPWQFTNYLILKEPGTEGDDGMFTFATSSRGGLNAIGELCKLFGRTVKMKPGKYPIVALKVDSYMHPNKAYGRIKVPVLDVIGWAPQSEFAAPHTGLDDGPEIEAATAGDGHHYKAEDASGRAPRGSASPAATTKF